MAERKLSHSAYVILGMLRLGARSGYEIKCYAESSIRFFWSLTEGQIYPELKRLESEGLVSGRSDPQGDRPRRVYELTDAGVHALADWLQDAERPELEIRDLALVKLFFADMLPREDLKDRLRAIRERSDRELAAFREKIIPAGIRSEQRTGAMLPVIIARFGHDLHAWIAEWTRQVERELESEDDQPSCVDSAPRAA